MFHKKHYNWIANQLKYRLKIMHERYADKRCDALIEMTNFIYQLSDSLQRDDKRFDRRRFIETILK